MNLNVTICGFKTELKVLDEGITCNKEEKEKKIDYENIISIEKIDDEGKIFKLHIIEDNPFPDHKLTTEEVTITSEDAIFEQIHTLIADKIHKGRPKKVVIFVNPIGGRGKGEETCKEIVVPVLTLAGIQSDVVVSAKPGHAREFAESYDFKTVDGLVIMGGDGTISEIVNVMMRKVQQEANVDFNNSNSELKTMEFPVGVIPTGTGNGLANVAYGCKDALTSTLYIVKGKTMKYDLLGSFNENNLVDYAVICTFYGMVADLGSLDTSWKKSRFFILRLFELLVLPLWYLFWKPIREINVEMTYHYLENRTPEGQSDDEKASNEVICEKRITNALAMTYDLDLEDLPINQQPQRKDQFTLLDYTKCGKITLLRHFYNLRQLTKEHLETTKDFLQFSLLTGYRIRVTEDNDPADHELNLNYSIDGEMHRIKTPDLYVKLFPRCFTVYTSYQGSRRWW